MAFACLFTVRLLRVEAIRMSGWSWIAPGFLGLFFFCSYAEPWRLTSQELQEPRCLLSPWNRWDHEMKRAREECRKRGSSGLEPTADRVSGFQLHCLRAGHKISSNILRKRSQRNSFIQQNPRQGQKTEEERGLVSRTVDTSSRLLLGHSWSLLPRWLPG